MTRTFVVYVTYPNSSKEYAYLCSLPRIKQGDFVSGNNGQKCTVVRTAAEDPRAIRYVGEWSEGALDRAVRRRDIANRLDELLKKSERAAAWTKLSRSNPEAKKLLTELKKLGA